MSWDGLTLPLPVLTDLQSWSSRLGGVGTGNAAPQYGPDPRTQNRLIFCGPSNTGKRLTAQWIARELGAAIWKIPSASLVGRYVGETEKNLACIFRRARRTGWVLFLDEADALFGRGHGVSVQNTRYFDQEVSYLLRIVGRYRGPVIISTLAQPYVGGHLGRHIDEILQFS
jgi:hypothetical protein